MKSKLTIILLLFLSFPSIYGRAQENVRIFTLKQCIEYGLNHHPSVEIEANNVEKARQTAHESLSAYLPQVKVGAGITDNIKRQQTIIPAGTFGPGTPEQRVAFGTPYTSSMSVQLNQKIYDQSLLYGIKAMKPNIDYAKLQVEQNKEDLVYNIAVSYYQILTQWEQLKLLKVNKKHFDEILRVTQLRAKEGVAKKVDIKQVQVNLNNTTSQISTLSNNLQIAINTLKNNMGLPPTDSIVLSDTARWLNAKPSIAPYPDFDYAATTSGQLQKMQMTLYDLNRKSIKGQLFPTISLSAQYGANGFGKDIATTFDPLLDYSAVSLQFSWDIFTGFSRNAKYKEAVIDLNNLRVNYQLNASSQNLQYQNAKSQSNEARSTILTNKENMALASEVYDNTTKQYRQGIASLTDLLNAELSYKEAQNNYINSLLQYYIADLAVKKANGNLEDYLNQL